MSAVQMTSTDLGSPAVGPSDRHARVEAAGGRVAGMGSTVTFEDRRSGKRQTFELVSAGAGQPADGKLSIESPVGQALRGLAVGALARVHTPTGTRELTVVAVA